MLYIVSTPVGNPDDITLRALDVLRQADAVICEERREGARLLRQYQIENELVELNEHTERERVPALIERLQRGETLALISDHGTPLLADPGSRLVEQAVQKQIRVSAVPGASSLLAALVVSGLPMARFRFVGLLPAKKDERLQALRRLKEERDTWVIFDAPYRLPALLADLQQALGPQRAMVVTCDLTMPTEKIVRGTTGDVVSHFQKNPFKGEFVIVVQGKK
ncbi:MAG: 16S rRNA (cytidine(1402)-2'-O)-methyltransferase [Chloroflexi bacterium]|nr:16S rRNA (cytidine(1402)-2'-O)-methyltransferase [Chloroflexota bacterium]